MAAMEWVKLDGAVFQQGPDFELEKGWMSVDDAQQKLQKYGDKGLAVCVQDGDPSNSYCVIVPKGVAKFEDGRFYSMVFKQTLPSADDVDLFEDDFAETDDAGYDGTWSRPGRGQGLGDEFQRICLFAGISPSDIHQGQLGDCWLVSSFAAMAEFPDSIENLITPKTLAEDGHYTVKLYSYADQQWVNYEVDDRFPTQGGRSMYCQLTEDGEIWPVLLEKAFAIYSDNYQELDGGQCIFALGAMTGCHDLLAIMSDDGESWSVCKVGPTTNHVHDLGGMKVSDTVASDQLLTMLADFDQKNFVMCCGSQQGGSDRETVDGIHLSHAYTLLTVKQNCAGSGIDMVCLRNPHGRGEWTGDWSDDSDCWDEHPEIDEECGHEVSDDGLFWMTFEDFCGHYNAVWVCKQSMQEVNRGKKTIAATRAFNANPPSDDIIRADIVNPALDRKRALDACAGPCVNNCSIM